MEKVTALGTVEKGEQHILCTINPAIYTLEVVQQAAYIMADKAYIVIDGDPSTAIRVEIRNKESINDSLESLAQQFNEQLLNYAVYNKQHERNKPLREAILQRVLLTNVPDEVVRQLKDLEKPSTH
jgi:His-Xaa-Ser system protein HxsD